MYVDYWLFSVTTSHFPKRHCHLPARYFSGTASFGTLFPTSTQTGNVPNSKSNGNESRGVILELPSVITPTSPTSPEPGAVFFFWQKSGGPRTGATWGDWDLRSEDLWLRFRKLKQWVCVPRVLELECSVRFFDFAELWSIRSCHALLE